MRRFASIAIAVIVAATGAAPTARAALAERDGTVLRQVDTVQVAGRNDKGGRDRGGRDKAGRRAQDDRKATRFVWRNRNKKHRNVYFRFDRSPGCATQARTVRDAAGDLVVRTARICN